MSHLSDDLAQRLTAYLLDEGTPDERASLERWIGESPDRQRVVELIRVTMRDATPDVSPNAVPGWNAAATWSTVRARVGSVGCTPASISEQSLGHFENRIKKRIDNRTPRQGMRVRDSQVHRTGRAGGWVPRWSWASAAILSVGVACAAMLWMARTPSAGQIHTYHTTAGQQATVRLADGSRMTLAPATTVQLTPGAITVMGEAYFTIAPRSMRPVVVQTTMVRVRVLGTKFSVRQYPEDRGSRVVVEDGKVALRQRHLIVPGDTQVVLTGRTLAQVTDSGITVRDGVAIGDETGWLEGRLVFDNVPLRDVLVALMRAYGTDIRLTDTTLATCKMTMEASVHSETPLDVLTFLARTIDAHVTRIGDGFVIAPGRTVAVPQSSTQFPHQEKQYGR